MAEIKYPIVFFASTKQYAQHLVPIWRAVKAINPEATIPFLATEMSVEYVSSVLPSDSWRTARIPQGYPIVVAGIWDYWRAGGSGPITLVEHGVGNVYRDNASSNPGGDDRDGVKLYVCNNKEVADRNLARYPNASAVVVGSPWLDSLVPHAALYQPTDPPVIGLTWHWENGQVDATKSALNHYRHHLPHLAKQFKLLGHGHPRGWQKLEKMYQDLNIEYTPNFTDIVERAAVLCVDNSSAGPEFLAATGRPIVWLNCPWYTETYGKRFWDWTVGIPCADDGIVLPDVIREALADSPAAQAARVKIAQECFAYQDGQAAQRAATAILEHFYD